MLNVRKCLKLKVYLSAGQEQNDTPIHVYLCSNIANFIKLALVSHAMFMLNALLCIPTSCTRSSVDFENSKSPMSKSANCLIGH